VKGGRGYIEAVQKGKDPTFFVVLFEDSAAMLGLIVAFVGVWLGEVTGNPIFDGIASTIIGLILGATAAWLAYETKSLLIGERADRHVVDGIRRIARAQPAVRHVNEVLTMHMGPEYILVNISIDFADGIRTDDVEETIAHIDHQIKRAFPNVKRIFIEAEPRRGWRPRS
jgi:divalent metal cation (Fe/Co/Zn/Cd) transporter